MPVKLDPTRLSFDAHGGKLTITATGEQIRVEAPGWLQPCAFEGALDGSLVLQVKPVPGHITELKGNLLVHHGAKQPARCELTLQAQEPTG